MEDLTATVLRNARQHETAVAFDWVFLAAEKNCPLIGRLLEECGHFLMEWRGCRDPIIKNIALRIIELIILWTSTKNVPQKLVGEPRSKELAFEVFLIEMGRMSRVRARSDVRDHLNLVLAEQAEKGLEDMRRMAHCVQDRTRDA